MQAQELRANDGMSLFPLQGQFFVSLRVVDNEWLIGQHLAQRGEIDHAMAVKVHLGVFTPPGRQFEADHVALSVNTNNLLLGGFKVWQVTPRAKTKNPRTETPLHIVLRGRSGSCPEACESRAMPPRGDPTMLYRERLCFVRGHMKKL